MKRSLVWLICGLFLAGIIIYLFYLFSERKESSELLAKAEKSYEKAEKSTTIAERKAGFNEVLMIYLDIDKANQPFYSSGKFYYNLANTFYQLEHYPWAALYYYRAHNLMPREDKPLQNLSITLNKLKQPAPSKPAIWQQLFLIKTSISLPEALQLFFVCALICLFLGLLIVWASSPIWKTLLYLFLVPLTFITIGLTYQRYFAPLEGIIIQPTYIYRDAGKQYAHILSEPLPGGMKIEILEQMPDQVWIKVITPQGTIGFIPTDNVRVI